MLGNLIFSPSGTLSRIQPRQMEWPFCLSKLEWSWRVSAQDSSPEKIPSLPKLTCCFSHGDSQLSVDGEQSSHYVQPTDFHNYSLTSPCSQFNVDSDWLCSRCGSVIWHGKVQIAIMIVYHIGKHTVHGLKNILYQTKKIFILPMHEPVTSTIHGLRLKIFL